MSWEEDSQGTAGTMDTADNMRMGVSFSGIPDSDDGDDEEDELFEAADNLDLGAVDLCVSPRFCLPLVPWANSVGGKAEGGCVLQQ